MNTNRIVEAVGFAHRPGRNTVKRDISRCIKRALVWITFRPWIPLEFRQWLLFSVVLSAWPIGGSDSKLATVTNRIITSAGRADARSIEIGIKAS